MSSIQDEKGINQGFQDSPTLKIRTERRAKQIVENLNIKKEMRILEIGCGTGDLSLFMAENVDCQIVAVDASQKVIDMAQSKNKTVLFKKFEIAPGADLTSLGTFDAICGNGILHHLYFNIDSS
ncbi:MAG: class I SAM-dependent methyltransferase, partial [Bdellovibrionales bacterium]|nr:class I SAM-dependent methyltransferase [Bdellovibrionales bacterium]